MQNTTGKLKGVVVEEDAASIELELNGQVIELPVHIDHAIELARLVGKQVELCIYEVLSEEDKARSKALIDEYHRKAMAASGYSGVE
jgi:Holliday junction resolvasome RuvABC DNA-binding subunit